MRKLIIFLMLVTVLPMAAQDDSFEKFRQQQLERFNQFKDDKQSEYDEFRKRVNEQYAEFMRQSWGEFPTHEAEEPIQEKTLPPVIYEEPVPEPQPVVEEDKPIADEQPKEDEQPIADNQPTVPEEEKDTIIREDIDRITTPHGGLDIQPIAIAVKPTVVIVPKPQPEPEPIAPVEPKKEPYKRVSIAYYGAIITIGFPEKDDLKISALNENGLADAWLALSDSKYDITLKTALDARKSNSLCDWAYMNVLKDATEKQYGKTNEAVLAQAFLMTQSGYRVRLGMNDTKLYMLLASEYDIFNYRFYVLDGTKFYIVSGDKNVKMRICEAKYGKERSLSLQLSKLPQLGNEPSPKRTLTSKKGLTSAVSVNKNLIEFFNSYPQACFNGDQTTRWAAYANTPVEKSVKSMLYPPLKKAIEGLSEKEAVNLLLNWVQTSFEYGYDDQIWGGDRAFFAQETLFYPFCDCEDRSILFSRLVRDLVGLDVVLLYYPGHLATAVGFNDNVKGDYLTYNNRRYIVCDPTYINAGVGKTMPGMNNQQAQVIALK